MSAVQAFAHDPESRRRLKTATSLLGSLFAPPDFLLAAGGDARPNGESEEESLISFQRQGKYGKAARPISTSRLHVLPRFHLRPINLVVYQGP